jgi:hypothetical protein
VRKLRKDIRREIVPTFACIYGFAQSTDYGAFVTGLQHLFLTSKMPTECKLNIKVINILMHWNLGLLGNDEFSLSRFQWACIDNSNFI